MKKKLLSLSLVATMGLMLAGCSMDIPGLDNKINKDDVKIPKKVINSAVELVEAGSEDIGADMNVNADIDPCFVIEGNGSVDPDFSMILPAEPLDPGFMVTPNVSDDKLGSYNGANLSGAGDSWDFIFGVDGWKFDNDDGRYSFLSAINSKYPSVELYVYNYKRDKTTSSDILNYGIYGYDIDCAYTSSRPNMNWSGLTFGATADQILAEYGTPNYVHEGDMYTSYAFELDNDMELTFYVYPDHGLQEVNLAFFGGIYDDIY